MRKANLSILGLYSYDPTLFDRLLLPESVQKEAVVNNIVLECADMEAIYPSADFLKTAIGIWSLTNLPVWTRLEETLHYEYDPIANYDRTEEWEDSETIDESVITKDTTSSNDSGTVDITENGNSIVTESGENSVVSNGKTNVTTSGTSNRDLSINTTKESESSSNENGSSESDNTESVAGYNSENLVANQKAVATGSSNLAKTSNDSSEENIVNSEESSSSGSQETVNNDSVTGTIEKEVENVSNNTNKTISSAERSGSYNGDRKTENSKTSSHKARMFGNIGVTTTQEMIEAQRKVVEFNIISRITEDFRQRFCILVY